MFLDQISGKLPSHPQGRLTFYSRDGKLARKSFLELHRDVEELRAELSAAGLREGSVVGLAGPNNYAWILADLALLGIRCVSVAFPEAMLSGGDLEDLAGKHGLDCLLLTGWRGEARSSLPWVASLDERPVRVAPRRAAPPGPPWPEDVFSLTFSSGTAGDSKCLMMSKKGIENTILVSGKAWGMDGADNIFITMPFSSVQQRTMVYMAIWHGCDISMAPPERMYRALKEMSPTIFIGPPSFFELVENDYFSAPLLRRLFPALIGRWSGALLPARAALKVKRALYGRFHRAFGGRMRLLLVGSAPSRRSMLDLYDLLGLPLYQVYGANEFGWISFNLPGANRIGTVGKLVDGVRLELGPDGEVVVSGRSPQTLGYAFGPQGQRRATYLEGGRIATGDIGRVDRAGYLSLVGRKKNVIITKGGYKINPETVEARVEGIPAVERAVVFGGDSLSTLVCVIWLGDQVGEAARAEIRGGVDLMNQKLQAQERIGRIIFRTAGELSVDNNLLTRNFKVNRTAVFERYKELIVNSGAEGQP